MADIDMVVNLKGTEELLDKKNLGTGNLNLKLFSHNEQHRSHATEPDALWKEKLNIFTEQVYTTYLSVYGFHI